VAAVIDVPTPVRRVSLGPLADGSGGGGGGGGGGRASFDAAACGGGVALSEGGAVVECVDWMKGTFAFVAGPPMLAGVHTMHLKLLRGYAPAAAASMHL
jgi:hypothetical protein